jgi:hypothetical protein
VFHSPSSGNLSLVELEEGGGGVKRFSGEGATSFILRLRQRIRAAEVGR